MNYKNHSFTLISAVFGFYLLLSLPHLMKTGFWAPDADRIAMDGVFLKDFIHDLPGSLVNLYDYTIEYYAKYPALSVGYRPVFFPLAESLFYALFGISHFSARLAVLFFLFIGMRFWFRMVRELYDTTIAILSLLLWVSNPFVYQYAQQNMLEIPTLSMVIISLCYVCKYETDPSVRNGIITGICVGLTLWTNQKSGFILLLLLIYPVMKQKAGMLAMRNTWIAAGIILIFLIPLICVTLWLGDRNIEQSVGGFSGDSDLFSRLRLFKNLCFLYHDHFSLPVLLLALIGMIFSFIQKDSSSLIFATGILCVYIFFTIIKVKIPRYPMYWIPFFSFFGAVGLQSLIRLFPGPGPFSKPVIKYAVYSLPILIQLSFLPNTFVGYAEGYEKAAEYVLQKTKSPVIFFDGYANGQFIFYARIHDPDRQSVILRGDKLISSSSISYKRNLKVHLNTAEDIDQAFDEMGVHFAVVESENISDINIYDELRELLNDPSRFRLHRTIKVESNVGPLKDQNLLVYENLNYKDITADQVLNLRLPTVGKTIQIKLKKIVPGS